MNPPCVQIYTYKNTLLSLSHYQIFVYMFHGRPQRGAGARVGLVHPLIFSPTYYMCLFTAFNFSMWDLWGLKFLIGFSSIGGGGAFCYFLAICGAYGGRGGRAFFFRIALRKLLRAPGHDYMIPSTPPPDFLPSLVLMGLMIDCKVPFVLM